MNSPPTSSAKEMTDYAAGLREIHAQAFLPLPHSFVRTQSPFFFVDAREDFHTFFFFFFFLFFVSSDVFLFFFLSFFFFFLFSPSPSAGLSLILETDSKYSDVHPRLSPATFFRPTTQ